MTHLFRPLALLLCLILPGVAMAAKSSFSDLNGQARNVADYTGKGQWTVVMIWASDCSVCRMEAPELEAFHKRHSDGTARVLGLSVDGTSASGLIDARGFMRSEQLSFPSLVGEGEDVATLFYDETGSHLVGTPAFLIFNPQGALRSYQTGRLNMATLEQLVRPQPPLSVAEGR